MIQKTKALFGSILPLTVLITGTAFPYGSLQRVEPFHQGERKTEKHTLGSAACDTPNINKGAILQSITVLHFAFTLCRKTGAIAKNGNYKGCSGAVQPLTLLEALFHLKLKV